MTWHSELDTLSLPQDFIPKAEAYAQLLLHYNKTHNISGAKSLAKVYENIVDSVYPIQYLESTPSTCIDIGSGAGFPGIPLALALPDASFTLFEPIAKKSSFLHLCKSTLGLGNVSIATKRVEQGPFFKCDLICSRAVTDTTMLIKLCQEFIAPHTTLLFYKGSKAKEEAKELSNYKIYERDQRRYLFLKDTL